MVTIHISNFGQNQNYHVFSLVMTPGMCIPGMTLKRVSKHLETKGVWPEVPLTKTVRLGLTRNLFVMDWREVLESLGRFLLNLLSDTVLEIIVSFFNTLWQTFCFLWWRQWSGQTFRSCLKYSCVFLDLIHLLKSPGCSILMLPFTSPTLMSFWLISIEIGSERAPLQCNPKTPYLDIFGDGCQ